MIETERLVLRPWRDADRAPFHAMSQSAAVMEHLGGIVDFGVVDAGIARMRASQAEHGHCFWAVERRENAMFLGFCGLKVMMGLSPAIDGGIEIGWRLREDAWGQGYAREAAVASLDWGFANLTAPRIVAITVPANVRSRGLMERLGMARRPDLDFGHPAFAEGHSLHRHVAYVMDRPE